MRMSQVLPYLEALGFNNSSTSFKGHSNVRQHTTGLYQCVWSFVALPHRFKRLGHLGGSLRLYQL
jgi:hypothetical protein